MNEFRFSAPEGAEVSITIRNVAPGQERETAERIAAAAGLTYPARSPVCGESVLDDLRVFFGVALLVWLILSLGLGVLGSLVPDAGVTQAFVTDVGNRYIALVVVPTSIAVALAAVIRRRRSLRGEAQV